MPSERTIITQPDGSINMEDVFTPEEWAALRDQALASPREPGYAPIYDELHPPPWEQDNPSREWLEYIGAASRQTTAQTSPAVPIMIGAAAGLIVAVIAGSK